MNFGIWSEEGESVFLCGGDENAVKGVGMDWGQGGGRQGRGQVKLEQSEVMAFNGSWQPFAGWQTELEFARGVFLTDLEGS